MRGMCRGLPGDLGRFEAVFSFDPMNLFKGVPSVVLVISRAQQTFSKFDDVWVLGVYTIGPDKGQMFLLRDYACCARSLEDDE